jgi:hypothetical protein
MRVVATLNRDDIRNLALNCAPNLGSCFSRALAKWHISATRRPVIDDSRQFEMKRPLQIQA